MLNQSEMKSPYRKPKRRPRGNALVPGITIYERPQTAPRESTFVVAASYMDGDGHQRHRRRSLSSHGLADALKTCVMFRASAIAANPNVLYRRAASSLLENRALCQALMDTGLVTESELTALAKTSIEVPHPGTEILDLLYRGRLHELAMRMDIAYADLEAIVRGVAPITAPLAMKLARVSDKTAEHWMALQNAWDLAEAQKNNL